MIGENIFELRKKLGLTQKELADKVFVSPQAVSKWENNEAKPDSETLDRLAKVFGVNPDLIKRGSAESPLASPVSLMSAKQKKIVSVMFLSLLLLTNIILFVAITLDYHLIYNPAPNIIVTHDIATDLALVVSCLIMASAIADFIISVCKVNKFVCAVIHLSLLTLALLIQGVGFCIWGLSGLSDFSGIIMIFALSTLATLFFGFYTQRCLEN
ncbi:MAG: helix-turn-helix domain-containing protein [Clostridiales bacterium]|jgi:transcriptional regulator with XRE-family HTH domain|nr:helix-turn-helix domain-containing protein [Clostridiales bacterium]